MGHWWELNIVKEKSNIIRKHLTSRISKFILHDDMSMFELKIVYTKGNIAFLVLMCLKFVIFVSNRSMTNVDIHTFFKSLGIQDLN